MHFRLEFTLTIGTQSATYIVTTLAAPSGGGWGGWSSSSVDYCPLWDKSWSPYDNKCNAAIITILSWDIALDLTDLWSWTELEQAYNYAYKIKVTNQTPMQQANMNGYITRAQLAKMVAKYMASVTSLKADTSVKCSFNDMSKQTKEIQAYAKTVCQLGVMWVNAYGNPNVSFNPNLKVTKAQFITILSRILRGKKYNTPWADYYAKHLAALKGTSVLGTNVSAMELELRGDVMLLLYRVSKQRDTLAWK